MTIYTHEKDSGYISVMVGSYHAAAWWADCPEELQGEDRDVAAFTARQSRLECVEFCKKATEAGCNLSDPSKPNFVNPDEAGHNFWLTRQGHGTGFWDNNPDGHVSSDGSVYRHWDDETGEKLTKICKEMGERHLYVNGQFSKIFHID